MIELGINDLYIEAGNYGYTLKQRKWVKDSKNGEMKEAYDAISYHGNLEAVLNAALNETVRDRIAGKDGVVRLAEALAEVRELHRAFTEILQEDVGRYEKVGGDGDA